ncbi:MAG: PadR family transcriptional regulator [Desulfurococcales archaeon]|nr:PadR family transcriptional regulator [Desulfurococcales archaeon]
MSSLKALVRLNRKLTVENLWLYVLACLVNGPTYAYDIRRRIRRVFGFNPSTITLYTVIYKLSREGLVRVAKEQPKTYEITEEGRRTLEEAVKFVEKNINRIKEIIGSNSS